MSISRASTASREHDASALPADLALVLRRGTRACESERAERFAHDRRELDRHRDRAHALEQELLSVEERERSRLSMDLHDGLSQTLALLKLKLGALRRPKERALDGAIAELEQLIDHAHRSVRSITFELCPPVLHELGLEAAVQGLARCMGERYGLAVVLEDDGRRKPTDEVARVVLFRSIRELLINAAKHAHARVVRVTLKLGPRCIQIAVEDDGVGIARERLGRGSCGLFSIRERLAHVGGSMRIESAPGRGTKISLCAPLAATQSTTRYRAAKASA